MTTAAIVLIGNELLSGKTVDTNAAYLVTRLRELGVDLRRVVIIPDEPAEIAAEVTAAAARFDHVFTSGGIGPTHDDITIDSVAAAFGVEVQEIPELAALVRAHHGDRLCPAHLRMARVPAGTQLIYGGPIKWPVIAFRNIYILPGVPQIFRAKFDAIAERFRDGAFFLSTVYLSVGEGLVAERVAALESNFEVSVGSYPRFKDPNYKVRITIEARTPEPVLAAARALVEGLEPGQVIRVEPPLT